MNAGFGCTLFRYRSVAIWWKFVATLIKKRWFLSLLRWVNAILRCVQECSSVLLIFSLPAAADRSMTSSLQEAREAMTNVACDVLRACLANNASNRAFTLMVPYSLRLIPLYMLSMIKSVRSRPTPFGWPPPFPLSCLFRRHFELVVRRN